MDLNKNLSTQLLPYDCFLKRKKISIIVKNVIKFVRVLRILFLLVEKVVLKLITYTGGYGSIWLENFLGRKEVMNISSLSFCLTLNRTNLVHQTKR